MNFHASELVYSSYLTHNTHLHSFKAQVTLMMPISTTLHHLLVPENILHPRNITEAWHLENQQKRLEKTSKTHKMKHFISRNAWIFSCSGCFCELFGEFRSNFAAFSTFNTVSALFLRSFGSFALHNVPVMLLWCVAVLESVLAVC